MKRVPGLLLLVLLGLTLTPVEGRAIGGQSPQVSATAKLFQVARGACDGASTDGEVLQTRRQSNRRRLPAAAGLVANISDLIEENRK